MSRKSKFIPFPNTPGGRALASRQLALIMTAMVALHFDCKAIAGLALSAWKRIQPTAKFLLKRIALIDEKRLDELNRAAAAYCRLPASKQEAVVQELTAKATRKFGPASRLLNRLHEGLDAVAVPLHRQEIRP